MAYTKEYREANAEKIKEYHRRYYQENRQRAKEQGAERYKANKPVILKRNAEWKADHPEKMCAYSKMFRERHPERKRQDCFNRRAQRKQAYVEHVDPQQVFVRDGGVCQICLLPIGDEKWHIDHTIAIARGGEHSYANTQLSHASCNLKKHTKNMEEFEMGTQTKMMMIKTILEQK